MDPSDSNEDLIPLTNARLIECTILKLPTLAAEDVPLDDSCPICLVAFSTIIVSSPEDTDTNMSGVTKLEGCGHLFCRPDLIEWIRGQHGTCPACRHLFLELRSEWEEESSDGDYVPGETDDDMDDFFDTDDDGVVSDDEEPRRVANIFRREYFSDDDSEAHDEVANEDMVDENPRPIEGVPESFSEVSMASGDEEVVDEGGVRAVSMNESEASGSNQIEGPKQ